MPVTVQIVFADAVLNVKAVKPLLVVAVSVIGAAPALTGEAGAKLVMVWLACAMVRTKAVMLDPPLLSVTVTEKLAAPPAEGVPDSTPPALKLSPAGSAPEVTANDNPPTPPEPPEATMVWL